MSETHLWQKAAAFAAWAHRHQYRKDDQTPYASHTTRVALTVACVFDCTDETVLAAALLHDVIEDCDVDYDDLDERFGAEIADIVACLSKDTRLVEEKREAAYDRQLAAGPWQAKLIKLADVYDNLIDTEGAESKRNKLEKVRRALTLADDDPRLEPARRVVSDYAAMIEESLEAQSEEVV